MPLAAGDARPSAAGGVRASTALLAQLQPRARSRSCAAGSEQGAETVERLQRGLRLPDFVARYGGGEYAIVLPETGAEGARRSVARVREQLIQGGNGTVAEPPLSAGIVTYPHPAVSQADDLFALVEAALARGKAQSGERVGIAD